MRILCVNLIPAFSVQETIDLQPSDNHRPANPLILVSVYSTSLHYSYYYY